MQNFNRSKYIKKIIFMSTLFSHLKGADWIRAEFIRKMNAERYARCNSSYASHRPTYSDHMFRYSLLPDGKIIVTYLQEYYYKKLENPDRNFYKEIYPDGTIKEIFIEKYSPYTMTSSISCTPENQVYYQSIRSRFELLK